jgi:hypothetical protein
MSFEKYLIVFHSTDNRNKKSRVPKPFGATIVFERLKMGSCAGARIWANPRKDCSQGLKAAHFLRAFNGPSKLVPFL